MPHKPTNRPAYQPLKSRMQTADDKANAAIAALSALSGTLGIAPSYLATKQAQLKRAVLSGDYVGMGWNDDGDTEGQEAYQLFGSVAVVEVSGILVPDSAWWLGYMGYCSTVEKAEAMRAAEADANVKTIVVKAKSPGGHIDGIAEFADTVADVAKNKRVITYTGGPCCSCAYWVASQTSRIYASRLADLGCIGTRYTVEDWSEYFKQMGVSFDVITSTGAEVFKGMGEFGTEVTPEQRADFKRLCDEAQVHFNQAIALGRFNGDLKKAQAVANGQIHIGPAALALGLADEIVSETFDVWLSNLVGADGVDYEEETETIPANDFETNANQNIKARQGASLPKPAISDKTQSVNTGTAHSGKEKENMEVDDFRALAAKAFPSLFKTAPVIEPVATAEGNAPVPTADALELTRLRDAEQARITALKTTLIATATTAFKTNPSALEAAKRAIDGAKDEPTLNALGEAYKMAIPETLKTTTRTSHGQTIDGDDGDSAPGATGATGINYTEIYGARRVAMGQSRGGNN